MHVFILAGGYATRLWPLTEKRAKPLLPLAGKPIINYLIESLPADMPIAVSTNAAFGDDFRTWQKTYNFSNVEIIVEETMSDDMKLGTLGALSQWITRYNIDDDIFLLTGDNYFGCPLHKFLDAFDGQRTLVAAHDIQSLSDASAFGTIITESKAEMAPVMAFEEKPKEPKTTLISTGASILPRAYILVIHEYAKVKPDNVGGIFEEFLARSIPIIAYTFTEKWYDIGSFYAYLEATTALLHSVPSIRGSAEVVGSRIEGSTIVGQHCVIENSVLRNVVVFDNCVIRNCVLEDCIVDSFAHLESVDLYKQMIRERSRLLRKGKAFDVMV